MDTLNAIFDPKAIALVGATEKESTEISFIHFSRLHAAKGCHPRYLIMRFENK